MRGSIILAAACASILAPGLGPSATAATKHAAPSAKAPFLYDTTGVVDVSAAPASVTGPPVLQFQGVTGATFVPGSDAPIQLGQFVVPAGAATSGQASTYNQTPFEVQVRAPGLDKTSTVPLLDKTFPKLGRQFNLKTVTENSLLIRGVLNGTVSPTGQSDVTATVASIRPGGLEPRTTDHATHYAFPVRFSDLKLPPSWSMTAQAATRPTPAAQVLATNPQPTPEPSTFLILAAAIGGLALARRASR